MEKNSVQDMKGEDIKPRVSVKQVPEIVYNLYGLKAIDIKPLPSYMDLNFFFHVKDTWDNRHISSLCLHGYVLKVLNWQQSQTPEIIAAQDAFMGHLRDHGISTQEPLTNKQGTRWSLESFSWSEKGRSNVVRVMEFIPGTLFRDTPYVAGSFYNVGRYLGILRNAAQDFHHPAYDTYNTAWSLENVSGLKDQLKSVTDECDVRDINDVIVKYEGNVLPLLDSFSKGVIHGDFNDQNLLMIKLPGQDHLTEAECVHDVTAVIDFDDGAFSYYVMDVAICIAHLSWGCSTEYQLDVGGHVLAGYLRESTLTSEEMSAVPTLVAVRSCACVVYGATTISQDPENEYLQESVALGRSFLRRFWNMDHDKLHRDWKTIIDAWHLNRL